MSALRAAYREFLADGTLPATGSWKTRVSTNVVTIYGRTYQCAVVTEMLQFPGAGELAVTTNEVFIWIDRNTDPKIIPPSGYRAPLFSGGF